MFFKKRIFFFVDFSLFYRVKNYLKVDISDNRLVLNGKTWIKYTVGKSILVPQKSGELMIKGYKLNLSKEVKVGISLAISQFILFLLYTLSTQLFFLHITEILKNF